MLEEYSLDDMEKLVGLCHVTDDLSLEIQRLPILKKIVELSVPEKDAMRTSILSRYDI